MTPTPVVRDADDVDSEPVGAADGLSKAVLIDESDGAPTFAMRRFTLAPGAEVPSHTNEVEHEQYVLAGEYTVGISEGRSPSGSRPEAGDEGEEYQVGPGDALLIPAGAVHWYRNDGDEAGAFICVVPNGDDSIEVVED